MLRLGFLLLSGGRSSRMGSPKALIEIDGNALAQHIAKAGEEFEERIFSVNDPQIPTPPGYKRIADLREGCGPMGGLHAALTYTSCDALVTAPCDTPRYSREIAQFLAESYTEEYDAMVLVEKNGRAHPLLGVYSKRCLPVITEHIDTGRLKMMRMLENFRTRQIVLPDELDSAVFCNLNTPEDVKKYRDGAMER